MAMAFSLQYEPMANVNLTEGRRLGTSSAEQAAYGLNWL